MKTDKKPVRVVVVPVRQAVGLLKGKPDLETVLNKLWAQGYAPIGMGVGEGAVVVTCVDARAEIGEEKRPVIPQAAIQETAEDIAALAQAAIADQLKKPNGANGAAEDLGAGEIVGAGDRS